MTLEKLVGIGVEQERQGARAKIEGYSSFDVISGGYDINVNIIFY